MEMTFAGYRTRAENAGRSSFSVSDFRVPSHYLTLIAGEAVNALLADTDVATPGGSLPTTTFVALCLKHFRTNATESWGDLPRIPFGTFGLLVSAMSQASTLRDALARLDDAMRILRPELSTRIRRSHRSLSLSIVPNQSGVAAEVGLEFFAVALHCSLRWLTGDRLKPLNVRAPAAASGHEVSLLTILQCPLERTGTGVTIHYDRLLHPIRPSKYDSWASQELFEFHALLHEAAAEINANTPAAKDALIARVEYLFGRGIRSEAGVAAHLRISSASLRRRLAEIDTTFRALQNAMRRDVVDGLLQTEKPLAAIATETGFSDVRSLRRACLRWFGKPPALYRQGGTRAEAQKHARRPGA